jgi:hypothetical protein
LGEFIFLIGGWVIIGVIAYNNVKPVNFNESNSAMTNKQSESFRFNSSVFSVVNLNSEDTEDKIYWLQKSPSDRLIALEYLRQVMYGYDPNTTRLQRVFEIAKFPSS